MATFTSGISWETDEWFRTFSESFPQYTQPGIWIAAEERFASLRGAKLEWEATTRTVRLKLKNSRGQPYTLAMHFYPGAVHAAAPIVEAAAKIPGLQECLRAGDLPAPLLEAINASGLDIFMRRPGSIQFDPGMMSSECALLIAAFMHDLELDPGAGSNLSASTFKRAPMKRFQRPEKTIRGLSLLMIPLLKCSPKPKRTRRRPSMLKSRFLLRAKRSQAPSPLPTLRTMCFG